MSEKIVSLKHTSVDVGKLRATETGKAEDITVPRISPQIIENRWRAVERGIAKLNEDDDGKFVRGVLEKIASTKIILDQRDIYYSLRMAHRDWKLAGHDMKTEEAYNAFVGKVMEKVQLATGLTMQSMGVRAGPRGYITGDDKSYFILPNGQRIPVSANPVIQFNLVDEGTQFKTQARKLIHYEKAAGLNSLVINDLPTMLEMTVMTSQGYNVEAATKMHSDMEKRGLQLYVLGDADPHGMNIQLMYGRASKSNAYMPDSFYPKKATLLGLFPRIAKELDLPPEKVSESHLRVIDNLKKLMEETNPTFLPDAEILEEYREQWEWQSLNGLGAEAPAIYMIEALYAKGDEIKYVPDAQFCKKRMVEELRAELAEYVDAEISSFAEQYLLSNFKDEVVEKLKEELKDEIQKFDALAQSEVAIIENMKDSELREAVKLKLVENPKQYWNEAMGKILRAILDKKFDITAEIESDVEVKTVKAEQHLKISKPEVPPVPLEKKDIVAAIEKKVSRNIAIIQKLRVAIQKVLGKPKETW